jgi:hypothetical protein
LSYDGRSIDRLVAGLVILSTYDEADVCAVHDTLYAGPHSGEVVIPEDADALKALGWFYDEDNESWGFFT